MSDGHEAEGADRCGSGSGEPPEESRWSAADHRTDYLELTRGLRRIGSLNAEVVDDAEALARELERLRDHVDRYRDEEVDAESVRPPE